jgi:hypothetical protein
MPQFQDLLSRQIWNNGFDPVIPHPNGYDPRDEVICPGELVIKEVEKNSQ